MKAVRVAITGRVQGVGFRYWVEREAHGRGLDGWVRNRRDGSVKAVFQGETEAVDSMLDACRAGPRFAAVKGVEVSDWAEPVARGFLILPSA